MRVDDRVPRYIVSVAVSAAAAAGVFSGLFLFVAWTGWYGAAGVLAAAVVFLAWFYGGRRPDLDPGKEGRRGSGSVGED